jgi:uncharacterized membrane protein YeaQ/YmgE (transglycosylase-associated protein family)
MVMTLWIILGLLTGYFVSSVVTKQQKAVPLDMLLGVFGAVVAGQLSVLTESVRATNPGMGSLFVAIAGAIVTVVAYRTVTRKRHA